MTLESFYFLSVSTAATLFCLILALVLVWGVWFALRIRELVAKLTKMAEAGNEMAEAVKSMVTTTSDRFVAIERALLKAQGISQIASRFSDAWHNRKKPDEKTEKVEV